MLNVDIKGVVTAIITPFTKEGEVDVDSLRSHIQWLIESGIHGLCPLGTTGEFQKLNREQRNLIVKVVLDEVKTSLPIIVGTGDVTTRNTIRNTLDAKDRGATAALVLPPWIFKYAPQTLIEHYQSVAEKTDFPIFLYELPSLVGYSIPPEVVIEASQIDNILGIKESGANILNYQNLINQTPKEFNVIQGYGSLFLPSLILGGTASINGESNIAPKIIVDMYHSYMNKDYEKAKDYHFKLVDLISVILYGTFPAGIKKAMNMMGLPGGSIVAPATTLTNEEEKKMEETLIKIGLLNK